MSAKFRAASSASRGSYAAPARRSTTARASSAPAADRKTEKSLATCRRRIGNGIASPATSGKPFPSQRAKTCSSANWMLVARPSHPAKRCATSHIIANPSRALGPASAMASSISLARPSGGGRKSIECAAIQKAKETAHKLNRVGGRGLLSHRAAPVRGVRRQRGPRRCRGRPRNGQSCPAPTRSPAPHAVRPVCCCPRGDRLPAVPHRSHRGRDHESPRRSGGGLPTLPTSLRGLTDRRRSLVGPKATRGQVPHRVGCMKRITASRSQSRSMASKMSRVSCTRSRVADSSDMAGSIPQTAATDPRNSWLLAQSPGETASANSRRAAISSSTPPCPRSMLLPCPPSGGCCCGGSSATASGIPRSAAQLGSKGVTRRDRSPRAVGCTSSALRVPGRIPSVRFPPPSRKFERSWIPIV
jgi:hypothetical protein